MRKLCVIGDPVEHSLSPLIQNAMIKAAGLDFVYNAERVAAGETDRWLERARTEGYVGFNATMPHKERLVKLADELSSDAALFRSVNTVCIHDGKVHGHNTDGEGFLRALLEADMDPAGKNVLVLGAGGAAKAVVYKLVQQGAKKVTVANRDLARAESLCSQVSAPGMTACGFSRDALCRHMAQSDLLINCTSLGMTGMAQFPELSFLQELRLGAGVFDLIYSPAQTELLREAAALGHKTANGLGMLIWQAVFALEHFAQTKLDGTAMAAVARRALEGRL